MTKLTIGAAILAVTSALALVATAVADDTPGDTPVDTSGVVAPWVHTQGTNFVDKSGNRVYLRGFNANSSMGYKKAAALGANFIRLPVYWSDVEPVPPVGGVHTWDPAELAAIDTEVQTLLAAKVNVLIDFHQTGWSPYFDSTGRGMPIWLYSPGFFPQPKGKLGLGLAKMDFATNPAILPYYKAYMGMIIKRYRGYPNVVGWELYNEPQPGKLHQTHDGTQALISFQAKLANYVRSLDPGRTIFFSVRQGGDLGFLNADLGDFGSLNDLALDLHDRFTGVDPPKGYSPDTETWYPDHDSVVTTFENSYVGTEANQLRILDQLLAKTKQWNIPLLVGEWGARINDSGLLEYQRQMLDAFRKRKLSWSRWALTSHGPERVYTTDYSPTAALRQLQQDLQTPY